MELTVFIITMWVIILFGVVGLGVYISDRVGKKQRRCTADSCSICSRNPNVCNSDMGSSDKQINSGYDLGVDDVINILRVLVMSLNGIEKVGVNRAIDLLEAMGEMD